VALFASYASSVQTIRHAVSAARVVTPRRLLSTPVPAVTGQE